MSTIWIWNLRRVFTTGGGGRYGFYCLRLVPYRIPVDWPAGKILHALDEYAYRPSQRWISC
jgi:hypothetical protein